MAIPSQTKPAVATPMPVVPKLLRSDFDRQRAAYLADPTPDYRQRREDLLALKRPRAMDQMAR